MFQKSWKRGHKNSKELDKNEMLKQLVEYLAWQLLRIESDTNVHTSGKLNGKCFLKIKTAIIFIAFTVISSWCD